MAVLASSKRKEKRVVVKITIGKITERQDKTVRRPRVCMLGKQHTRRDEEKWGW